MTALNSPNKNPAKYQLKKVVCTWAKYKAYSIIDAKKPC
jgi:hypothetical protein